MNSAAAPWVKICGVRDVATARWVAALRPDAIGLNFYERSPRHVSVTTAAEIVRTLPPDVEPVAVFVNASATTVRTVCEACGIHSVQLHGDESPEFAAGLGDLDVIRAYRVEGDDWRPIAGDIERLASLGVRLRACLVEPRVPGVYGGGGHTLPWERLQAWAVEAWPPLLLAGGLNPSNVGEAVRLCRPWGVDVAGGVESAPGIKDAALVRAFIAAAGQQISSK